MPAPARPARGRAFGPRRAAVLTGVSLALILGAASIVPAAAADGCSGDACDNGAWAAARGAANENSYWGMSPGHNCTNYVAWRLIGDGVERPRTHPGDAAEWAANATTDGYLVDNTPTVGSVAQWGAGEGGNGPDGHVAYVEAVNDDGTIVVSEDFWHGGDQLGPLTFRTIPAASVPHFIHYLDTTDWLRTARLGDTGWTVRGTGIDPVATAMTALVLPTVTAPADPNAPVDPAAAPAEPTIFFASDGELRQASATNGVWSVSSTGIASNAETLDAVAMWGRAYVMSIDADTLILNAHTESGWQRMNTGIEVTGEVAAVDLGGLFPTVYVSQGGSLYEVWGDTDGWHARTTGIEVWGPISAVVPASGWPEIYSVESGMLFRLWQDVNGWHKESTGITATGRTSATTVAGVVSVTLDQDDRLYTIDPTPEGWLKKPLGIQGGSVLATVDAGGTAPVIFQLG